MADEKVVRIRVLAVADPSLKTAFAGLEEGARKASQRAKRIVNDAQGGRGGPYRSNAAAGYESDVRAFEKSEGEKRRIAERNARYIERVKSTSMRNEQREMERTERATARKQEKRINDVGKSIGRGALSMGRGAIGAVGDAARGAGIDFSPAALMANYISAEQAAIRATNSGRSAQNKVATASDITATTASIDQAAVANKVSRTSAATALEAFVSKSSDIDLGQQVLSDIGKIANATGSDFTELATAGGVLAATMGDIPNKADAVTRALRIMAKQGSMGTVEVKDLATMMPRLAAGANEYGGDYEKNVSDLGAIAQMAMKGGAATAPEATNTAQAMSRDIIKDRTLKKFAAEKIPVFTDETNTKMRSIEDIIVDVFDKTKGDKAKIAKLLPNQVSARGVKALTDIYLAGEKKTPGGGKDAIRDEFKRFRDVMSGEDTNKLAANYENSMTGKAQDIQNKAELMFAKNILGPVMGNSENSTQILDKLGLGGSPMSALLLAGGAAGAGMGGGDIGAIAALTVTTLTVGTMIIDQEAKERDKDTNKAVTDRGEVGNAVSEANRAIERGDTETAMAQIGKLREVASRQEALASDSIGSEFLSVGSMFAGFGGVAASSTLKPNSETFNNASAGAGEARAAIAALEGKLGGGLKEGGGVNILNAKEIGTPTNSPVVDHASRSGARF